MISVNEKIYNHNFTNQTMHNFILNQLKEHPFTVKSILIRNIFTFAIAFGNN